MVRLATLFTALAAAASVHGKKLGGNAAVRVPGRFIVEYDDNHDSASAFGSISADADKTMDLNYKLFRGASIVVKNLTNVDEQAAKIASLPTIKNVWPFVVFSLPEYEVHSTGASADAGAFKRQSADVFSTHAMTQVNLLRDAGFTGSGIKIGIVDTGTDYNHPALGGGFGPGHLVEYGTDLVGDAYTGFNTPQPDPDPLDNCNGHGTHVAGIIAAQTNNPYGIVGAATGVTLGSFRVIGCNGQVGNDVLIAAFNLAYEAGSDIITASIGGVDGWSEEPWAVAVQRIVENGVPCTLAAGNDGPNGLFYASTAANGKKVTAVASVDNILAPALLVNATYTVDGGAAIGFGYTPGVPANWAGVSLPLWAASFNTNTTNDGCSPYPDSTPDLSGYVVLVHRGTCTFVSKVTYAVQKGAKYVIIYNNAPGTATVEAVVDGVEGIAEVTQSQGIELVNLLAAGHKVVATFPADPSSAPVFLDVEVNDQSGGFLSTYTTWGPTFELDVKPQIATPGGLILSLYPQALGSYAVASGTSMATPLAAGIVALIAQVRGTKDPKTIENLLSASGNPNLWHNGKAAFPYLAAVPQQGSGLVQAYDAAYATTLLSVSSLYFNDTQYFVPVQNFTISNTGKTDITYSLGHAGAATAYTFSAGSIYPDPFPGLEAVASYAALVFGPSPTFTVPAGQRKIVTVALTPPAGLDASRLPVYSGYVTINGTDGSSNSVPYTGVYGNMHDVTILDPDNTYVALFGDADLAPVPANTTFILAPPGHSSDPAYANTTTYPDFVVGLAFGTALILVDVVPLSTCKPVNTTDVFGTPSIGQVYGFPFTYNGRVAFNYGEYVNGWDGRLADGTYAPAGVYKLAVRTLHIYGDPSKGSEYDLAETVPFRIAYRK